MFRTWFVLGTVVLLVGVAAAQEAKPPVAPNPTPQATPRGSSGLGAKDANPDGDNQVEYMIELKVLEGKGIFPDGSAWPEAVTGDSTVELLRKLARRPPAKTTAAGAAPHPVVPPRMAADRSAPAMDAGEDELWEGLTINFPGITTVAAPRLVTFARQSVTFSIQTSSRFSYLEPLGDGKYQARYGPVQELGMKVTLAVQHVEGDDTCVELSPLEIQITALDGRELVEGLDLDVGKPIISTRSLKTTAKMKLGATRLIAIPSGPKTQAAMLLRVNRASFRSFEPPPSKDSVSAMAPEKIVGVGAALASTDAGIVVHQILPDTPAALNKALKVGERIIAVGQADGAPVATKGLALADVVALIRGPEGTTVRLTVVAPGEDEAQARVVSLVRGELKGMSKVGVPPKDLAGAGDGVLLTPGSQAPQIKMFSLADRKSEELADFSGQIVVLNFWTTWCKPCWKVMADLQTYADKKPEWRGKVVLIAASVDDSPEALAKHLRNNGWNQTHNVQVGAEAMRAFHIGAVSTQYVIDPHGKIVAAGGALDIPEIIDALLLKK